MGPWQGLCGSLAPFLPLQPCPRVQASAVPVGQASPGCARHVSPVLLREALESKLIPVCQVMFPGVEEGKGKSHRLQLSEVKEQQLKVLGWSQWRSTACLCSLEPSKAAQSSISVRTIAQMEARACSRICCGLWNSGSSATGCFSTAAP